MHTDGVASFCSRPYRLLRLKGSGFGDGMQGVRVHGVACTAKGWEGVAFVRAAKALTVVREGSSSGPLSFAPASAKSSKETRF